MEHEQQIGSKTEIQPETKVDNDNYMLKVDLVKCPGCKYESSTENVRLHIKRLHMDGKFCKICQKNMKEKITHTATHMHMLIISQLIEQCNECSKIFMLDSKRAEDDVYTCKECSEESSDTVKNDPSPVHPHLCDTCYKRFAHRKTLNEHMRTVHSDNQLYRCEMCPRVFHYRKNLNAHKRVHTNPATCEICFVGFSSQHNLNRHMVCHVDPPEYNCSSCGKLFRTLSALETHKPCRTKNEVNDGQETIPFENNIAS